MYHLIKSLTTLNLYYNQIGDKGAQEFADVLKHNTVKSLFFSSIFYIYNSQTLTKLNLSSNEINSEGIQYLANALKHNKVRLLCLHLSM